MAEWTHQRAWTSSKVHDWRYRGCTNHICLRRSNIRWLHSQWFLGGSWNGSSANNGNVGHGWSFSCSQTTACGLGYLSRQVVPVRNELDHLPVFTVIVPVCLDGPELSAVSFIRFVRNQRSDLAKSVEKRLLRYSTDTRSVFRASRAFQIFM